MENEDLIDYEEEVSVPTSGAAQTDAGASAGAPAASGADEGNKKGSYVGIHSTGFRDFLLKPELLRAISDLGFEHPSEVQQECIPQSILGMDVLCQAKSGMGKTAVFVLASLQQRVHASVELVELAPIARSLAPAGPEPQSPYMRAVSMKLPPASTYRSNRRCADCSSAPQPHSVPKVIVPSAIGLTRRPERPSRL